MTKRGIIQILEDFGFERDKISGDYWNYTYSKNTTSVFNMRTLYVSFHKLKKVNNLSLGSSDEKIKIEDLKESDLFDYFKNAEILKAEVRKYKLKQLGV